jgi:hypothetical protein
MRLLEEGWWQLLMQIIVSSDNLEQDYVRNITYPMIVTLILLGSALVWRFRQCTYFTYFGFAYGCKHY